MKFGLCTGPENLEMTGRLGFDYIECSVTAIEAMSDGDFAAFQTRVNQSPIKMERANALFPAAMRLVGPEADHKKIGEYLERAFPRLKALGGNVAVFGSGRARVFPPEMPYCAAFRELINVTRLIGQIAAKYGITVAIEPLNKDETNCVNSVREGAMLQAAVDHPSVELLADLYHMLRENEPMEDMVSVKKIKHAHIALLEGRAFPTVRNKDVAAFFDALKKISYSGTMSIEGKTTDFEADAAAALKVLRNEDGGKA